MDRPRVVVSACLLGEPVRFDGGHCRNRWVTQTFAEHVDLIPVCPEMEMGMGSPRPTLRLVDQRLVESKSGQDWTGQMDQVSQRLMDSFGEVHGFILKRKSPSCGIERVPNSKTGRGLFADAVACSFPDLPMEDDGRLNDLGLRDRFVTRVFAHHRLSQQLERGPAALMDFHRDHKPQLMAHDERMYRQLGRLVGQGPITADTLQDYARGFRACLAQPLSNKRQANVLYHALGFFKKSLDPSARRAVADAIESYRQARLPFAAPISMLRMALQQRPVDWLNRQTFMAPYPGAFSMREFLA